MRRFLSLALLALLCLFAYQAKAEVVIVDEIAYSLSTDADGNNIASVPQQSVNKGKTSGEIVIPETITYEDVEYTVTEIAANAYGSSSYSITSVTIPKTVTTIGSKAFYNSKLETLTFLGDAVVSESMCQSCTGLKTITFGGVITSCGTKAFYGCTALESVTFAEGANVFGTYMFYNCKNLTSIEIPEGATSISTYQFYGCTSLVSIELPSSLTAIGNNAFYNCSSLASIEIPSSVATFGQNAFYKCVALTSIEIPEGVVSLLGSTFYQCTALKTVTLPSTLTSLQASYDFYGCTALESITCKAATPPSVSSYTFYNVTTSGVNLYVPASSVDAYKENTVWGGFNIEAIEESGETEEATPLTLVSPESEDGVITTDKWASGTELVFKTTETVSKSAEVYWNVYDVTEGVSEDDSWIYGSYASYDTDNAQFTCSIYSAITFYEDHTYQMTAYLRDGATKVVEEMVLVTIIGTTPASANPVSTVTLVSSDPEYYDLNHYEIEIASGEDLTVTLTFSDYVKITATINQSHQGETYTGNSISLNATGVDDTGDSDGYYTQWTFTIPASELEDSNYGGEISVTITGTDTNGKLLFDASGETTLTYSYTLVSSEDSEEDLTGYTFDPEDGATVSELSTITVGNELGIAVSWLVSSFDITDDGGEVVATISAEDDIVENYESDEEPSEEDNTGHNGEDVGWGNAYSVTITLPTPITDDGTYTVTIPYEFFVIGIGDVSTNSPAITLTYTVDSTYVDESGSGEGDESGNGSGEGGEGGDDENGDTTGIDSIRAAIESGAELYNLAGQKINTPVKGVNVVKYTDGTVKKILQK